MPWAARMTVTLFVFTLPLYAYVWWRLSTTLANLLTIHRRRSRFLVGLILLALSLLPLISLLFYLTGNGQSLFLNRPQVHWPDVLILYPYWWTFITILAVFPYLLILEIPGLLLRWGDRIRRIRWQWWLDITRVVLVAGFGIYVGIRAWHDTTAIRIDTIDVPIVGLPATFENLSLALVADIQVDRYTNGRRLTLLQHRFETINPDFLFFAGDLVTRTRVFIPQAVRDLCRAPARVARVGCMGDHDYWSGPQEISTGLQHCGWDFLQNAHHVYTWRGKRILVTGVTYIYSQRPDTATLDALFSSAPPADLKILLVHQPAETVMRAAVAHGYQLMLAGHTHGGQIVFRPFGITLTPAKLESPVFSGLGHYGLLPVVVTNGVGLTLAPLRYQAPAEVTRIRLLAR